MTESNPNAAPPPPAVNTGPKPVLSTNLVPEDQHARWLKYGTNVVASSIIVILLAAAVVYIAQWKPRRIDTTQAGIYSLKPQTLNVIRNLPSKVKIVSLYTKSKPPQDEQDEVLDGPTQVSQDQKVQLVTDLLQDFQNEGKNITVESIDPVANPYKIDSLIADVTSKYGGEIDKYKKFIEGFNDKYKDLKTLTDEQVAKVQALPLDQLNTDELQQSVGLAIVTVRELPPQIGQLIQDIQKPLKQSPPDYKTATTTLNSSMVVMGGLFDQIIKSFTTLKADPKVPEAFRKYMTDTLPEYQKMKDIADGVSKEGSALGDLKLDTLRTSLQVRDPILVMGESDWKVITPDQMWVSGTRDLRSAGDDVLPSRFAGEQQVTGAILALTSGRRTVAVLRNGGQSMSQDGMPPYEPEGVLSAVCDRLKQYNFDVIEKDLSGMSAAQAEAQGRPPDQEATDAQINDKNVVWIVDDTPSQSSPMMPAPPTSIGPRIAEHLKAGGAVLLLVAPTGDDLAGALSDWGVDLKPTVIAAHERVSNAEGQQNSDQVEQALRFPFIFQVTDYGDHAVTRPLQSLDSLMIGLTVVQTHSVPGKTVTPLIPVPGAPNYPRSWGETDIQGLQNGATLKYDKDRGDLLPPLFGGAASEQPGGGRLLVIGSDFFCQNQLVNLHDQNTHVTRFPGNSELFTNAVFWLAHAENLIGVSPASMDVSRIGQMSDGTLRIWRYTVALVLPVVVVLGGILVYSSRRD